MSDTKATGMTLDHDLDRYDSKFRFVLLASERAEQLLRGARPKIDGADGKPTNVAMQEFKEGLVPWEYGPAPQREIPEGEEGAEEEAETEGE